MRMRMECRRFGVLVGLKSGGCSRMCLGELWGVKDRVQGSAVRHDDTVKLNISNR